MKAKLELILTHSTMRGEKAGAEIGAMASDLTLKGPLPIEDLKGLFTTSNAYQRFIDAHWDPNSKSLAIPDFREFPMVNEFENVAALVASAVGTEASAEKFPKSRLKGIELKLLPNFECDFKATLQVYPTDPQWGQIAHLREKNVRVTLSGGVRVALDNENEDQGKLDIQRPPKKGGSEASERLN